MAVCRWLEADGGGARNCWSDTFDDRQCTQCLLALQVGAGSTYDATKTPQTPS